MDNPDKSSVTTEKLFGSENLPTAYHGENLSEFLIVGVSKFSSPAIVKPSLKDKDDLLTA